VERIYQFKSYKDYLRNYLKHSSSRGATVRLAEAAGCQSSYLSKVLQPGSKVQLTHDHIFGISEFLNLSKNESHFLEVLLEKDRASQKKYKLKIEKEIETLRNENLKVASVLNKAPVRPDTAIDQTYYSHWLYSALHIAVSIPSLQDLASLSKHFFMPPEVLRDYLNTLEKNELVQQISKDKWSWKRGDFHLSNQSPLAVMHQMTWRSKAIEDSSQRTSSSVHYTVVQSISEDDFDRLRSIVLEWIENFQKISGPSNPEELVNLNLDFYKVVQKR
jgi:uncharacterized protein (TIGR02147 family)